jgi:hypothetical protein
MKVGIRARAEDSIVKDVKFEAVATGPGMRVFIEGLLNGASEGGAGDVPSVDREGSAVLNREAWLLRRQKTQWPIKDEKLTKLDDNFFERLPISGKNCAIEESSG